MYFKVLPKYVKQGVFQIAISQIANCKFNRRRLIGWLCVYIRGVKSNMEYWDIIHFSQIFSKMNGILNIQANNHCLLISLLEPESVSFWTGHLASTSNLTLLFSCSKVPQSKSAQGPCTKFKGGSGQALQLHFSLIKVNQNFDRKCYQGFGVT